MEGDEKGPCVGMELAPLVKAESSPVSSQRLQLLYLQ
jgi:hypothetical protein